MSYFLVADQVVFSDDSEVDSFGKQVCRILGPAFVYNGFVSPAADPATRVLLWKLKGTDDLRFEENGAYWAIGEGQFTQSILDALVFTGGRPKYEHPVWGQYSVVVGSSLTRAIYGWQTTPNMRAVSFLKDTSSRVISNNPLLVSLLMNHWKMGNARPSYSEEAVGEYLALGYTTRDRTMFESVAQVPARHILISVEGLEGKLEAGPSGLSHPLGRDHSMQEAGEALAEALSNSFLRAVERNRGVIDMRVSGGKDSRIMMGLARQHGIDVVATCIGNGRDMDSRIAKFLAELADFTFVCRNPPSYDPEDAWNSTVRSLRATLGTPQSEAHFTPNLFTSAAFPGQTLMFGNWPAYHGVYHRKMRYTESEVVAVMDGTINPMVDSEVLQQVQTTFELWRGEFSPTNRIEQLYDFGLCFRGSNWMKSAFTGWSSQFRCAFFMSDQELSSLADQLSMYEHISYAPEFLALREIWPEAAALPLAEDTWRFESFGPSENPLLDPSGYGGRNLPRQSLDRLFPVFDPEAGMVASVMQVFSPAIRAQMCRFLKASASYHSVVEPMLDEVARQYINEDGQPQDAAKARFLWRVMAVTVAVSLSWFWEVG